MRFDQVGKVVLEPAVAVHETVEQIIDVPEISLNAEAASMDVQYSEERALPATTICPVKKVKLSSGEEVPRDPRLRARGPGLLSSSPELHHKVPAGAVEQQHGVEVEDEEGGGRHGPNSEGEHRHGHNSGGEDQHGLCSDGAGVEGDAVVQWDTR